MNLYDAGKQHDVRFNRVYHNVFFHNAYAKKETFKPFLYALTLTKHSKGNITDVAIMNNIFWMNNGKRTISYYHVDRAKQVVSHNWKEAGDPLFLNAKLNTGYQKPKREAFHLQEKSPCIDAGGFLTRTNSEGRGSIIPVLDASFFANGFGIVEGDRIQFEGKTERIKIVKINYEKNLITVDGTVAWKKGQGVSLPFKGTKPDIGAFEYSK